ncbi:fimbrial protein [Salmonella enterica]|nr:hypothetical protein [Salmonella enterica]EDH9619960.1 hypothetical protein [Salmonella enterica subsp. enterica serovar Austin]EBS8342130.1 hypothetical protein [Salmonella enterica]EBS8683861.1 hypothetical protein [Salmonella enterica]EBT3582820.1 hypothetical protein [Salmonella enterica]
MKIILRLALLLGLTFSSISGVWGATGYCTPVNGTQTFPISMGTINVTDISKNVAGTTFLDMYSWNLGSTYQMTCDCEGATGNPLLYYSTVTSLAPGHSDGDKQYYGVNDYLEVSTSIYLGGLFKNFKETPWNSVATGQTLGGCSTPGKLHNVSTGSQGKVSLYIKKPFVGTSVIPNLLIESVYISTVSGNHGPTPLVNVYLSGTVVVPQSCTINAGKIIPVDFGQIMAGEFKQKGALVDSAKKTVIVPIKCNNVAASANLTLRLQAIPSKDNNDAIQTSNPDVGIVAEDAFGHTIKPNIGLLPFQLDDSLQAKPILYLTPVSTTGVSPAGGDFHALAYIRVDFQ